MSLKLIMKIVTIHEAKTNLSRLIEKACRGEEIIIARGDHPVVRLVPVAKSKGRRKLGILKDKLIVGREFFEPLPPGELDRWGDRRASY
jgi:prevent-host-death family protein